jgi:DNA end-binding protein Ku
VLVDDDEIRNAYPKTMQTIEIEAFVKASEIPFVYLEKPYYLEPIAKADKVYALLREAMIAHDVIGIARVVMHTKEHLAALMPDGPMLVLNTLRWATEVRKWDELRIPAAGKAAANLKDAELKMAGQLVSELTVKWKADAYHDNFAEAIKKLIKAKVAAGKTHEVTPIESPVDNAAPSNVVDLTALLKNSLGKRRGAAEEAVDAAAAATPRKAAAKAPAKARRPRRPAAKKAAPPPRAPRPRPHASAPDARRAWACGMPPSPHGHRPSHFDVPHAARARRARRARRPPAKRARAKPVADDGAPLARYNAKRDFTITSEPGRCAPSRQAAVVRDPEARRDAAALRLPARARRRAAVVGHPQGAQLRSEGAPPGGARGGSPGRLRHVRGHDPEGPVRRRHGDRLGQRHVGAGGRSARRHEGRQAGVPAARPQAGRAVGAGEDRQAGRAPGAVAAVQEARRVGAAACRLRRRQRAARQRRRASAEAAGRRAGGGDPCGQAGRGDAGGGEASAHARPRPAEGARRRRAATRRSIRRRWTARARPRCPRRCRRSSRRWPSRRRRTATGSTRSSSTATA